MGLPQAESLILTPESLNFEIMNSLLSLSSSQTRVSMGKCCDISYQAKEKPYVVSGLKSSFLGLFVDSVPVVSLHTVN